MDSVESTHEHQNPPLPETNRNELRHGDALDILSFTVHAQALISSKRSEGLLSQIEDAVKSSAVDDELIATLDITDDLARDAKSEHSDAFSIEGGDTFGEIIGIEDIDAWVAEQLQDYPSGTLRGLNGLSFTDKINPISGVESDIQAFYNEKQGLILLRNPSDIKEMLSEKLKSSDVTSRIQEHVSHLLHHEVGHFLHREKASLPWLRKWIALSQDVPLSYTIYKRHDHLGSTEAEDIADANMLYIKEPERLRKLSPERFELIEQLIDEAKD